MNTDHNLFNTLLSKATVCHNRDTFTSEWATSSIWGDDPESDIPLERILLIGKIWDLAHMSIKDIRKTTGLSQAAFAMRFCIPRRTVENWESEGANAGRECPIYVRLLLARACGLMDDFV